MRKASVVSWWLMAGLAALWFSGCGSDAPTFKAEDHALAIKTEAMEFVAAAKQGPQVGAGSLEGFLEAIEAYESGPVGQHGDTYAQMLEAAQSLQKLYQGSGAAAEIQQQVDKIASLAGQLPGDVVLEDESAED